MRILKNLLIVLLPLMAWTAFIIYGISDGFLLRSFSQENTADSFIDATKEKIAEEFVGNLGMVLVEDGEISNEYFYSQDQPIHKNSVFQVASVSKWITSWGVLKLVQDGILDLDKPADDYLTRWHLPQSEFDNNQVTIRRLLSHTSGLADDLGYYGYGANDTVQTLEQSLTKASDAYYSEGIARVGYEPGSQYMYSGASYTLLQLIIEEVSGESFQNYMTRSIFAPLGMMHSTFDLSVRPDLELAQLYKDDGSFSPPIRFTALAAASLYTCTEDLSKFLLANINSNTVLNQKTIQEMIKPEGFINELAVYGLGPHLYSQNDKHSYIIGHDGSSDRPVINTAARIDLTSQNGIIVLEMGNHGLATELGDEWIFWKAGIADYTVIMRNKSYLITLLIVGSLLLLFLSLFIISRSRNQLSISTQ